MALTCRARSSIVRMVMGSNFFMGHFIFLVLFRIDSIFPGIPNPSQRP